MTQLEPDQSHTNEATQLPPEWHYEATVNEIEAIISQIEAGEMDLADVFDQFDKAVQYLKQCDIFLASRQQQMDVLIEQLGDETQL